MTIGSNYNIYVKAVNVVGSSAQSDTVEIWAAMAPYAPTDLIRTPGSNAKTTIDIEWTAAYNGGSTIVNYEVWWNEGGSGPISTQLATTNGNTRAY